MTTLTVQQLIVKLAQMPQDLEVVIEGCDCTASAGDVELVPAKADGPKWSHHRAYVFITRPR